jgi:hypothetical protein
MIHIHGYFNNKDVAFRIVSALVMIERPSLSISTPFLRYMMLIDIIEKED